MKYELEKDETILYECLIKYKNNKTYLTLTNKKILFQKEKLFSKKLKLIGIINLNNIKVYKEKVLISQNDLDVTIQTLKENITFSCLNKNDARKIISEINHLKGNNKILEGQKIINNVLDVLKFCIKVINLFTGDK